MTNFCSTRPPARLCEDFEQLDAGAYPEFVPFDGTSGLSVDTAFSTSPTRSLLVRMGAGNADCSTQALRQTFPGNATRLQLDVGLRLQSAADHGDSALLYLQSGAGSALCQVYLYFLQSGSLRVLETFPLTDGGSDFVQTLLPAAAFAYGRFQRVAVDWTPASTLRVRLDGVGVLDAGVNRPCPAGAAMAEFKVGFVCEPTAAFNRRFNVDDLWFDAQ